MRDSNGKQHHVFDLKRGKDLSLLLMSTECNVRILKQDDELYKKYTRFRADPHA